MNKLLAVSGGVDSMVLLDLMAKKYPKEEIVVATFNHGTRKSADDDVEFVSRAASLLGVQVLRGGMELGENVSEDLARKSRYEFLRKVAKEEGGEIYTAHHLDDLVESVAINLLRGTGFRGLAVLSAPDIKRPFIDGEFGKVFDKRSVLQYAAEHGIAFRQDPTNTTEQYLRNRLRTRTLEMTRKKKLQIFELWSNQKKLVSEIDDIVSKLVPEDLVFERAWFRELDENVSLEILRAGLNRTEVSATRPQLRDFLKAILDYKPGKKFNLPNDKLVKIGAHSFKLEAWYN